MTVKYWVATSNHGHISSPKNMLNDFIKEVFWATDAKLKARENSNIAAALSEISINDRVAISSFRNNYKTVQIAALGTVIGINDRDQGKIEILWDAEKELYKGPIPIGTKRENWQQALFQLTTVENIRLIFPDAVINQKVTRLAWNELGWKRPSGLKGKSESPDTHEGQYGYGHEEWLFDTSKLIEGYHYGFLEPIRKGQNSHANKTYPIWLYSIDGATKKRYWVGFIKRAIVIDEVEAVHVKHEYEQRGWLEKMEDDILLSGSNKEGFSDYAGLNLFNIKFKPEDLVVNDEPIELPEGHPVAKITRYTFANYDGSFNLADRSIK